MEKKIEYGKWYRCEYGSWPEDILGVQKHDAHGTIYAPTVIVRRGDSVELGYRYKDLDNPFWKWHVRGNVYDDPVAWMPIPPYGHQVDDEDYYNNLEQEREDYKKHKRDLLLAWMQGWANARLQTQEPTPEDMDKKIFSANDLIRAAENADYYVREASEFNEKQRMKRYYEELNKEDAK